MDGADQVLRNLLQLNAGYAITARVVPVQKQLDMLNIGIMVLIGKVMRNYRQTSFLSVCCSFVYLKITIDRHQSSLRILLPIY